MADSSDSKMATSLLSIGQTASPLMVSPCIPLLHITIYRERGRYLNFREYFFQRAILVLLFFKVSKGPLARTFIISNSAAFECVCCTDC